VKAGVRKLRGIGGGNKSESYLLFLGNEGLALTVLM
jgi:hypothetical protein